ncbi:ATP-binding protein [Mycobacterium bourgelatii]|uniref:Anti-sigma regulatory factor n=1 Tax=Mycobacterium bourgelatii TaxID=1273442 RepID=A0A7I9YYR0_MYCBU|nr:ATP-binding protein [Mycobacterium bourgelatii]MCV6976423.1 ATP-binding protein [Mycobacterium bourgelatii]GFG93870.1 anti-sigma regulatory factor [Mycobacterium bourgelatii]
MTSNIDDRFRFVRRRIAADAHTASRTRVEFRRWLDRHFTLGAERFSDLLLAVSEALSNAAEFAYVGAPQRGTMDVSANYDVDSDTLAVTVSDHGRWRQIVPAQGPAACDYQVRGRGIPLMRALADEATIDPTPHGTNVRLTWNHLTKPSV